jgi:hypothetical protein
MLAIPVEDRLYMSLTVKVNESGSPSMLDIELWYWTPFVQPPMLMNETLPPPGVVGETDHVRTRFDGFVT